MEQMIKMGAIHLRKVGTINYQGIILKILMVFNNILGGGYEKRGLQKKKRINYRIK